MDHPWDKVELRFEVSDFAMRALYQLHYLWGLDRDEPLNRDSWARHYASLLLNGAVIPVVAVMGGLPVGTIEIVMFTDPFTGDLCIQPDKAYVFKTFRKNGIFDKIMGQVKAVALLFGAKKVVVPAFANMVDTYKKAIEREGLVAQVYSTTLLTEIN